MAEAHAPLEDVVLDGVRLDAVLSAVPQDPDQVVDEDSRGARSREHLLRAADLEGGIVKHLLKIDIDKKSVPIGISIRVKSKK